MFVRAVVLLLALFAPIIAKADWFVAESKHFQVYSENRAKLEKLAKELETFDSTLRVLYNLGEGNVAPVNRVTVYVISTGHLTRLTNSATIGGRYIARPGRISAFGRSENASHNWDAGARAILLHEYAHHFLNTYAPNIAVPHWFSEGFAESMATALVEDDGSVVVGHPPQFRGYEVLGPGAPTPEQLLTGAKLKPSAAQSFYGAGWLLTHYLMFSGARDNQLRDYIRAINAGAPNAEAIKVFGDLSKLNKEIIHYRSKRFPALRVAAAAVKPLPTAIRTLTAAESAMMTARIQAEYGVNDKSGPENYKRAVTDAAPYPNDPIVQRWLAETAYDVGNYAAAESAADRAIAADPKNTKALLYKARARRGALLKRGDGTAQEWQATRRLFAAANRSDPEDPEPLIGYYESFIDAKEMPTPAAEAGLIRALELAPFSTWVRLQAAQRYLAYKNVDMARQVLAPLAASPHHRKFADHIASVIELIDAEKIDEAVAKLVGGNTKDDDDAKDDGEDKGDDKAILRRMPSLHLELSPHRLNSAKY